MCAYVNCTTQRETIGTEAMPVERGSCNTTKRGGERNRAKACRCRQITRSPATGEAHQEAQKEGGQDALPNDKVSPPAQKGPTAQALQPGGSDK